MYYSGKNCEIESDQVKKIKQQVDSTTYIVYIIFGLFAALIIAFDCMSYREGKFSIKKKVPHRAPVITRPVYKP